MKIKAAVFKRPIPSAWSPLATIPAVVYVLPVAYPNAMSALVGQPPVDSLSFVQAGMKLDYF